MEKHIALGLFIPVAFFGFTGAVKSIVQKEWLWSNFYLGIDIALAALANGIVNIVDGVHQTDSLPTMPYEFGTHMYYTSMCILAAVGALFGAMALHQRFDATPDDSGNLRLRRGIWLGIVGNLIGGSVLAMFIYMKLRKLV
jgi:hypothetical protein